MKLEEVLTSDREPVEIIPSETYKQITVRLHHNGVVLRGERIGQEIKSKQYLAKRDQFIISRIDARNGAMGLVPQELHGAIVTNDFLLYDIDESKLFPKYFDHLTSTKSFVNECIKASKGTTNRVRLKPERFLEIEVLLPPIEEQKHIVARIESLLVRVEEAIRLHEKAVEEVDALMNSALQNLNLSEFEVVSKGIGECSSMKTGKTPPTHISYYYGEDINWYCPSDLDFTNNGYLEFNSNKQISHLAVEDNKSTLYEKDTILLVAIGGSIGKVAISKEKCSSNQQITGIKFSEEIEPRYGYYWIRKLFSEIVSKASQATLPIINQQKIGRLEIEYPKDKQIQRRIVNYLDSFQAKVDELRKLQDTTRKEIEELIPSILDKAFRGES